MKDRKPEAGSSGTPLWLGAAVILVAVFCAYLPALRGGFVWDDEVGLTTNPLIPRPDGLYYFWLTTLPYDYFPLTNTSFWLEWRLWGLNPTGYHVTNILLHALSSVILWRVLKRLAVPGAFVAGLLFGLHPVGAASVAWISERKNTLSLFFCLSSLLLFLRAGTCQDPRNTDDRKTTTTTPPGTSALSSQSWLAYWLSVLCFALALLAKTSVVGLPVILLLCLSWKRGPLTRQMVARAVPFFALAGVLALVTIWFQVHRVIGSQTGPVQTENFWQRLAAAGYALWFYAGKSLLPFHLSAVYPHWDFASASMLDYLPLLTFFLVLALAWRFRASWGLPVFCALATFAVVLLPTLGLVDMYYLTYSRVADHWLYPALPPLLALAVASGAALAAGGAEPIRRLVKPGSLALLAGALCWFGLATHARARVYAGELALWSDTVRKNPTSPQAQTSLGMALANDGRYPEAQAAFEAALRDHAEFPEALNNLGFLFSKLGKPDLAANYFERAVRAKPDYAQALNNWGINLFERGRADEGIAKLRAAINLRPGYWTAHLNLAVFLARQGAAEAALPHALRALQLSPGNGEALMAAGNCCFQLGEIRQAADYYAAACSLWPRAADFEHNLAVALSRLGHTTEAATHFARAEALGPNDPRIRLRDEIILVQGGEMQQAVEQFQAAVRLQPQDAKGHNRLGLILASEGKPDAAIAEFKEALRLDPRSAEAHKNLGNLLAGEGKTERALSELEQAIQLQPTNAVYRVCRGRVLASLHQQPEAAAEFGQALRLEPANPLAHFGLANCLLRQGQPAAAKDHYRAALKSRADYAEAHYQLALLLESEGDFAQSAEHLRQALHTDPDWPEALNNLAWRLATRPEPALRDGAEAVRLAKRASELKPGEPGYLDTLAAAYAEASSFPEAVSTAQHALALALNSNQTNLASELGTRLQLYRNHQPYREP